ncbi:MAG: haloacid dehalogenase [Synergistaceae bacterium]|nr:haloacid dehalogenase [Synergistaceae bacterium]
MVSSVPKPDMIVFDVDGVLVDASRSYPEVVSRALLWGWTSVLGCIPDSEGFSSRHFSVTKTHPAFNDDYDIAWAALNCAAFRGTSSLAAALPSPEEWGALLRGFTGTDVLSWVRSAFGERVLRDPLRQACEEMYFGGDEYEAMGETLLYTTRRAGLWERETPLASFFWRDLPLPAGIYTGRPLKELRLALKLLNWEDFPPDLIVTPETGMIKPSPDGLALLCEKTSASSPLFLGDAESDRQTSRSFGKGFFAPIGNFLPDLKGYENPALALKDYGLL